jgi:hypothetical protein
MPDPGFTRPVETVDRALTIAADRRAYILSELGKAKAQVEEFEAGLLAAEQAVLLRERHLELNDREVTGLLDERLRSRTTEGAH